MRTDKRSLITALSLLTTILLLPASQVRGKQQRSTSEKANNPEQPRKTHAAPRLVAFTTRSAPPGKSMVAHLPRLEGYYEKIRKLARRYPDFVHLEKIGESSNRGLPLYALKISDNAAEEEDESALLFSALHHAREPLGTMLCLEIAEKLASGAKENGEIRRIVESLEIWLVPIVNPEGYDFMTTRDLDFPWWRKNMRDNDGDGVFDPALDGVDLNRNYDYNWDQGGEGSPGSWFYRGEYAFSENETAALRMLALRENFVAGLSFHSYGEVVLYPWGNFYAAPDHNLIQSVGQRLAANMRKLRDPAAYGLLPLNGRVGQSSVWMYGRLRAIDYIVELADSYFTDERDTRRVLAQGLKGAMYFMRRGLGSQISGHVRDAESGEAVAAALYVYGLESDHVSPRRSEGAYGRFERWLAPGEYTIRFSAEGYKTRIVSGVRVEPGQPTVLEVALNQSVERPVLGNN